MQLQGKLLHTHKVVGATPRISTPRHGQEPLTPTAFKVQGPAPYNKRDTRTTRVSTTRPGVLPFRALAAFASASRALVSLREVLGEVLVTCCLEAQAQLLRRPSSAGRNCACSQAFVKLQAQRWTLETEMDAGPGNIKVRWRLSWCVS